MSQITRYDLPGSRGHFGWLPPLQKGRYVAYADYEILLQEFKDFFIDFLDQGCGRYNKEKQIMEYDHMCLSTYQHGVKYALEKGWIEQDQVTR